MTQLPCPHNSRWWDEREGKLRRFIKANPGIEGMTFTEIHHAIGSSPGPPNGRIPKQALAELCRLLGVKLTDSQIAH